MGTTLYSRLICILVFTCFGFHIATAQNTGEMDHIDCLYSKEVIIPFTWSPDPNVIIKDPLLDQTVFYNYRDQFSYWYKIMVKENAILSFQAKALNDSDSYAVYVYQYNQPDFCKQVYGQKVKPVKAAFFTKGGEKDPFDLSEKTFKATKDNTYYICVLNTSVNNCGHTLRLVYGKDTLRVKALHLPCKRDVSALPVTQVPVKDTNLLLPKKEIVLAKEPEPVITPSITPIKEPEPAKTAVPESTVHSLVCNIKDAKKKMPLDARYSITEQGSGEQPETVNSGKGQFTCILQPDKTYKVKCAAFGYKNTERIVKTQSSGGTQTLDIEMEPLKEGDNMVMRSIYFYPNTYALKKESADELQKLLTFLQNNETVTIEIQGHTNGDNRISKNKSYADLGEEWNFQGTAKKLSQKRAEVIKTYLESNGIPATRLTAKGYGGDQPIVKDPETNEEGQRNIRVEIVILKG